MNLENNETASTRKQFREAAVLYERALLAGRTVEESKLAALPDEWLEGSPLLLQALGDLHCRRGRLGEGRRRLEQAVRGFGAIAFPERLRSALCSLAWVLLRLGDMSAAETVLVFLKQEREREPDGAADAEIALSLACGSRIVGTDMDKPWFLEAIERFERQGNRERAIFAILEMCSQSGAKLQAEEWDLLARRVWMLCAGSAAASPVIALFEALRSAALHQWDAVYAALGASVRSANRDLAYHHAALALILYVRATLDVQPGEAAEWLLRLERLVADCPDDLFLQRSAQLVLAEGSSRLGRPVQANRALAEAQYLGRVLQLAEEPPPDAPPDPSTKPLLKWQIRLFGGLKFVGDGREISGIRWKRKKALELLVYLSLQPRYSAPKEQLADILQLGDDPDRAGNAIYVVIHQLKRVLEEELAVPDGVSTQGGLVSLREEAFEYVDAERYLALLRVADQLWLNDRGLAEELYMEAYLLYDELLPELPYIPWLDNTRVFLADKHAAILRKLSQYAGTRGDPAFEETLYRDWIHLKPDEEEAYRQLIGLLLSQHREAEIARLYDRFAERLRIELGTEPSAELRRMIGGIGR